MTPERSVLVLACGDKKVAAEGPVRALDLYADRRFAAARALEALGWTVVIISAKHGVIGADEQVAPYDQKMTADLSRRAAANIAAGSYAAHLFRAWTAGAERVVFLGGKLYAHVFDALVAATGIARADSGVEVEAIVGGGCGEHYSVLKALLGEEANLAAA